jgi:transcriptional regulator with XRE-family HTH domain
MYNDSTPSGGKVSSGIGALITAINKFPKEWALTPCIGKRNLWPQWQKTKLDRARLIEAIRSQTNNKGEETLWTGVSVVTGPLSAGIMAIDFDGSLALKKYLELSGGQPPITTKRWTSGREGHFQMLMSVAPEKWIGLAATTFFILKSSYRLALGLSIPEVAVQIEIAPKDIEKWQSEIEKWESGSTSPIPPEVEKKLAQIYRCTARQLCDKLELRWNKCSTLPPSIHPDTGKPYRWESEAPITECPDFILDLMRKTSAIDLPQKPKPKNPTYIDAGEKSLVDILGQEIIPRLDAEEFYGSYLKLKTSGKNLVALCPFHTEKTPSFTISPTEKLFKCFGCDAKGGPVQFLYQLKGNSGSPRGKDFYGVVMELADRVGVKMPDHKAKQNPESSIQKPKPDNVLQHPTNNVVSLHQSQDSSLSELGEEVEALLDSDLKKSQTQIKISELAQKYRVNSADVWKIYHKRAQEQEQEADRPDVATEIEALLGAHKSSIALTEVLPVGLAKPIEKLAAMLNLRSECYLAALLTQVASLFKVGTETVLRRDTDWRCVPNYNAGIVSEVSQLKTPIPKAIIDRPMRVLRERAQKEFEQAQANYETELNNWKAAKKDDDRGPAPKPPRQRIYSFDKTTGEGIIYQQAAFPDQALMYFCDELAGMLKSSNQYRGGKGSDEEDMLSFWNGTGTTVLRASGVRASVEAVGLSIFGTIQPDVLAGLLKDCSDSNGKFARFDFVFQPLAVPNLPEDDSGGFDLTPMLADLYQKIDALPAIYFEFDREAKEYHRTFTLACHRRRVVEPKQGLRGALGKMPEKVGKLATTIHALTCVFNGQQVTNHIPRSAVEAAVRFVKFAADQVASLYTEFSDRSALAPNLTKILLAAERKGGTITVRDTQNSFPLKQRPNAQQIKEWFSELEQMKYGKVTTVKKSVSLTLTTTTVTTVPQNLDTERVKPDYSTSEPLTTVTTVNEATVVKRSHTVVKTRLQSESLSDKALDATVVTVVTNSPLSKKLAILLEDALVAGSRAIEQIAAKYPSEVVREAIAQLEAKDPDVAEEIRDALEIETIPQQAAPIIDESSINTVPPKKPTARILELGDRVVVKDVGGQYQGVRGVIVAIGPHGCGVGVGLMVKFDKPVAFSQQCEFMAGDLMYLPEK